MSSDAIIGALVGGGVTVAASPYLARLTVTVPDAEVRRWWRGASTTRRITMLTAAVALVLGGLAGAAGGGGAPLPAVVALALIATPPVVIDLGIKRLPHPPVLVGLAAPAGLITPAAGHLPG